MLPKDSLPRRLPLTLHPEQRLRLEAFVFAIDLTVLAYHTLRDITARHGSRVADINDTERIALFTQAWTMVDQLHVIRQLLKDMAVGGMGPNTTKFYEKFESAFHLRNAMDHLRSNIKNLAARKGMRAPLFGALSYAVVEPEHIVQRDGEIPTVTGAIGVTLMAGSVPEGKVLFPMIVKPTGIPTSGFKLYAFDRELDLEDALLSLQELVGPMAAKIEAATKEGIEKLSAEVGVPVETLMTPAPFANMTLSAHYTFADGEPEATPDPPA